MLDSSPCHNFENWIQESLDSRQKPDSDPRVLKHLKSCSACRETLSEYQALENALGTVFDLKAETNLVLTGPPKHVNRNVNWRTLVGTLAASILVIVALDQGVGGQLQRRETGSAVAKAPLSVPMEDVLDSGKSIQNKNLDQSTVVLTTYYELTSELPGIRPIRSSVDATWSLLQKLIPASNNGTQPGKRPGIGRANELLVFAHA